MTYPYIPKELVNKIFEYYGRIKYRKGNYVNIIHANDCRYNIIKPIINKKIEICKTMSINLVKKHFYFHFRFDTYKYMGLWYEYNGSMFYEHGSQILKMEICFFNFKNSFIQIKTFI